MRKDKIVLIYYTLRCFSIVFLLFPLFCAATSRACSATFPACVCCYRYHPRLHGCFSGLRLLLPAFSLSVRYRARLCMLKHLSVLDDFLIIMTLSTNPSISRPKSSKFMDE